MDTVWSRSVYMVLLDVLGRAGWGSRMVRDYKPHVEEHKPHVEEHKPHVEEHHRPLRKRMARKEYVDSMKSTKTRKRTILRLATSMLMIWTLQFGIAVWFMVGQGYDRSTAAVVPFAGILLLPLLALLLRTGMDPFAGSRLRRVVSGMAQVAGLYLIGILGPGWIILEALSLGSPFDELWLMLGLSTVLLWAMLVLIKAPMQGRAGFAALLLIASAAALPGLRIFVMGFFG